MRSRRPMTSWMWRTLRCGSRSCSGISFFVFWSVVPVWPLLAADQKQVTTRVRRLRSKTIRSPQCRDIPTLADRKRLRGYEESSPASRDGSGRGSAEVGPARGGVLSDPAVASPQPRPSAI